MSARRITVIVSTLALAAATAVSTAGAASAAPGDWTQVSQTSSAARYPEIVNIDQPTMAWFGETAHVVWREQTSSAKTAYFTATLNAQGHLSSAPAPVLTDWDSLTSNQSLIFLNGQLFLSFSGLNPGRTGAQYYATSPDGITWSVAPGSMSATQSAYAAYGSDIVDNAGNPVWVGNPGTTSGVTWHVGTSDASPAPAGSDGTFQLGGCCAYDAAGARDAASGIVYSAFYSNSSVTTENGIQVGQILPASAGWHQAPGSTTVSNGTANSLDAGQTVAMAARPGGGVFVAYAMGYPTATSIRILNVATNATMDIPASGARTIAMDAGPDGRLWVTWQQGGSVRAVHTNPAATRLGAVGVWGAPHRTDSLWKSTLAAATNTAAISFTATTSGAINVWNTMITRTLGISASPATAHRGGSVTFTVTDAGDPVAGAQVSFGGHHATTNSAGRVTLHAPTSHGTARATASKSSFNTGSVSVRVR
jgi:hypothetical protein